jgi:hypothetical protein
MGGGRRVGRGAAGSPSGVTALLLIRRIVYTSLNLSHEGGRREGVWEGGTRGIRGRHDVYCRPRLTRCVYAWLLCTGGEREAVRW